MTPNIFKNSSTVVSSKKGGNISLPNLAVLSLTTLLLNACQTTSNLPASSDSQLLLNQQALNNPNLAKTTLNTALKKQRRSNYMYQSHITATNEVYRSELNSATNLQLQMSDNPDKHCEHMHDQAYVKLSNRADEAGVDVKDEQFTVQREALKETYLECSDNYKSWESQQFGNNDVDYLSDWLDGESEETAQTTSEDATDYNHNDEMSDVEDSNAAFESSDNSSYYETDVNNSEFLPNYDSAHTSLDKKKATLINDYLLEPLTITTEGVYLPLKGQLSVTPTLKYNIRNHQAIARHYILIDANEGKIYLWADSFAQLLSYYFDDKLGTQMKHKWLAIDLNDGSLPTGFERDFIKSHFAAIDAVRGKSSANEYNFLAVDNLLNVDPKPDTAFTPYLSSTPYIIERRVNKDSFKNDLEIYKFTFSNLMQQKYPDLFTDSNLEQTQLEDEDKDLSIYKKLSNVDSRLLMTKLFKSIKTDDIPSYEPDQSKLAPTTTVNNLDSATSKSADSQSLMNYAQLDPNKNNKWYLRHVYGIDNNHKIRWQLKQFNVLQNEAINNDLLDYVTIESLTQYSDVSANASLFSKLPKSAEAPNEQNVIDFGEYTQNLLKKYDEGEGTPRGEMVIESLDEIFKGSGVPSL